MKIKGKELISQTQIVSVVLITGVALILAGTAYYWGAPLLEKTQKSVQLQDAESFLLQLISNIEEASQSGDTKVIEAEIHGTLSFFPDKDEIIYEIKSPTLSYAVENYVPLNDMPPFKKQVVVFSNGESKKVPGLNESPVVICTAELNCNNQTFSFDTTNCAVNKEKYGNGEEVVSTKDSKIKYLAITQYCKEYNIGYLELENEEKLAGIKGQNHNLVLLVKALASNQDNMFFNTYRIVSREIIDEKTNSGYYIDFVGKPVKVSGDKKIKIVISKQSSEVRPGESFLEGDLNIIKVSLEVYE